jgi:uncharacterized protein
VSALSFRYIRSLGDVTPAMWDALQPHSVFSSYTWLSALEGSGLVVPGGAAEFCMPAFFDAQGTLVAAAPAVLKRKPVGEYGPENLWLRQSGRLGVRLLPKLQLEVPLTPVSSPRFLVRSGLPHAALAGLLLKATLEHLAAGPLRALTIARMDAQDEPATRGHGLVASADVGTRWRNEGYSSHADFLARMKSDYRYNIRRERRAFRRHGLRERELRGSDIRPEHWDAFHAGYAAVSRRHGSVPLLNRDFFGRLAPLGDAIRLLAFFDGSTYCCGALLVRSGGVLHSRLWSELAFTPAAAFEAALHRPIEMAIEEGAVAVDSGVWGAHKAERGFETVLQPNAHWLPDDAARRVARDVAARHRAAVLARPDAAWGDHYLRRDRST